MPLQPDDIFALGAAPHPAGRHDPPPAGPAAAATAGPERDAPLLVWDTETNGIGEPLICQLAYLLLDDQGHTHTYDEVWPLPPGARMSAAATAVHGLTAERVATSSVSPPVALDEFVAVVRRVLDSGGTVVGHNVQFDCRAINATAKRWGTSHALSASCMLDTCRESRRFSPLVDVAGRRKAFKNAELCA